MTIPPDATYEVNLNYCTSVRFKHEHTRLTPALLEFTEQVEMAMFPDEDASVHITEVSLLVLDEEYKLLHRIYSGTFTCDCPGPIRKDTE